LLAGEYAGAPPRVRRFVREVNVTQYQEDECRAKQFLNSILKSHLIRIVWSNDELENCRQKAEFART